jgi:hypothetical protein
MPLTSRIVFQMDQAASSDKSFLWHIRKCGEDSNLDCNICVCSGSHNKETAKIRSESLHNFTDF